MVSLAGGDASPQASAKLFWDKKRQQWVIFFFNLPPLARQVSINSGTSQRTSGKSALLSSNRLS
jgi:hypothetical protein